MLADKRSAKVFGDFCVRNAFNVAIPPHAANVVGAAEFMAPIFGARRVLAVNSSPEPFAMSDTNVANCSRVVP